MKRELIVGGICLVLGYGAGYRITRPVKVIEQPKPEVRQVDGSLVLERKKDAPKPRHIIPEGDKVEREVSVEVETEKPTQSVRVDLSLVSEPDGGKRVVASSPDGKVVGGADFPVAPVVVPPSLNWSVGGLYDPANRKWGGFAQYKKGAYIGQVVAIGGNVYVGVGLNF